MYYANNDFRLYDQDYLMHHGIKGQKWGVRNGPPYPLDASDHSKREQKAGWRSSLSRKINKKVADKAIDKINQFKKEKRSELLDTLKIPNPAKKRSSIYDKINPLKQGKKHKKDTNNYKWAFGNNVSGIPKEYIDMGKDAFKSVAKDPRFIISAAAAIVPGLISLGKIAYRRIKNARENRRKMTTTYDRRTDQYVKLKRPLTAEEQKELAKRMRKGETKTMILEEMKLLK